MARALALTLLMLLAGCASGEQWTFSVSRAAYDSDWAPSTDAVEESDNQAIEALRLLAFFLIPVAIDIVALPITLPHDLFVL